MPYLYASPRRSQERVLEQEFDEGKSLAQACYLPTPADVYVSAFRKWCADGTSAVKMWRHQAEKLEAVPARRC